MLRRLHRDERGVAMVLGMLVSVVVFSLGLVAVQLSQHNSFQSAFDRKRVQAIHAAEAGLDAYLSALPTTPPASLPCTLGPTSLPIAPPASYDVAITYYSTFPGTAASQLACASLAAGAVPVGALVVATGTAGVGGENLVRRAMQTEIRLNPLRGDLDKAIFSDSVFNVANNLTVNGSDGNDGDLYTNGNFTCSNSSVDYGSVEVPHGTASLSNSCEIRQDLWTNGSITLAGSSRVGHDAISANGSISITQPTARIVNNARMAGSCNPTPNCAGRVGGLVTTDSPSLPPAHIDFPTINYDAAKWAAEGYTERPFSDCTAARGFIQGLNGAPQKYVVRVTGACMLDFSQNTQIRLGGDLAIVVDGAPSGGGCPTPPGPLRCGIATSNNTDFVSATGAPFTLHMIVPKPSATPCALGSNGVPAGDNILIENFTDFTNVRTFIYSPCTVTLKNNNLGLGGQIYGGTVNISNLFAFTYSPILVPGAGPITGFNPDIAYLREIAL